MKCCSVLRGSLILIAAAAAAGAQTYAGNPNTSNLAAGVLDQTGRARAAVAAHDHDAAVDHITRAIATVNSIEQQSSNAAQPLVVPVYTQVETETTTTPVHKNGDLKGKSAIRGVEGNTTTTQLNVTAAGSSLAAAQAALQAGNWTAADAALAAVQTNESVSQSSGPMPLRMAQQNLELARARILEGKYHDAERPLQSAAEAIGKYESSFAGHQPVNVDAARQAILDYSAHVQHDHDGALDRIDNWMNLLHQWQASR